MQLWQPFFGLMALPVLFLSTWEEDNVIIKDYSRLCSGLEAFGRFGLPSIFVAFAAACFGYGLAIQSEQAEGIADSF